jgi:DNA-binding SARP family transcriptional activator/uncharacterized protein HemY
MPSAIGNSVGLVVRNRRLTLGLSQRQLGEITGLSLGMIRDLEQGRTRRPYLSTLRTLSEALGVDLQTPDAIPSAEPSETRILILGTMETYIGGSPIRVGSGKIRTLIACLALNIGHTVSRDSLIDALWNETPPANAEERVAEYIRKTRELLLPQGPRKDLIERIGHGYRLNPDMCLRDADEFLSLSEQGRGALSAGDHSQSADLLGTALRLWRGDVLPDIDAVKDRPEVVELRRRRSRATHDIADALHALNRQEEALTYLEAAAAQDPFDESMQAHLLLTLAQCGRQSEALARYQRFSHLLSHELGVQPGMELADAQRRILHQELQPPPVIGPRSLVTPRQLPSLSPFFTGRRLEQNAVIEYLDSATSRTVGTVPVVAIDGMAGIGKTAFALQAAHYLSERFPDGQLFVDLHGYSADRLPRHPHQVLEELLHALGVSLTLIPADSEARTALYRDRLAGTRTLVVLDNAAAVEQVLPLLPNSSSSLVLVTSRRRLISLDHAYPLTLGALDAQEALRLLAEIAPQRTTGEDASYIDELARMCGRLPLALRIVGALLRQRPWVTTREIVERLRRSLAGPDPLAIFDDGDRNLRSVFDLSVEALGDRERDMLKALAQAPGPDIDVNAAAALADIDLAAAENLISALVDHNLLMETEPGHFALHDLIRLYTAGQTPDGKAAERLIAYFDKAAHKACAALAQSGGPADSREQARSWMRREAANLLAVTRLAVKVGDHHKIISLADSCYDFFRVHGPWSDALTMIEAAVGAADLTGDALAGAAARTQLGVIKRLSGDFSGAVVVLRAAIHRLTTRRGKSTQLTTALQELGETYRLKGDFVHAEQYLRSALAELVLPSDRIVRAKTLTSLGSLALTYDSEPDPAIKLLEEAVNLYTAGEDLEGRITASCYLGDLHRAIGNYPEAQYILEAAVTAARSSDDYLVQANVLIRLGYLRHLLGDHSAADATFREALDLYLLRGSRIGEANTLTYIGVTQAANGQLADAAEKLRRAHEIYKTFGNDRGRAMALMYLAQALYNQGNATDAANKLTEAIDLFHDADDTINEAHARTIEGSFALTEEAFTIALASYKRALMLAQRTGRRILEADALHGIGKTKVATGKVAEGASLLEAALRIYLTLESPAAEAVSRDLANARRGATELEQTRLT